MTNRFPQRLHQFTLRPVVGQASPLPHTLANAQHHQSLLSLLIPFVKSDVSLASASSGEAAEPLPLWLLAFFCEPPLCPLKCFKMHFTILSWLSRRRQCFPNWTVIARLTISLTQETPYARGSYFRRIGKFWNYGRRKQLDSAIYALHF